MDILLCLHDIDAYTLRIFSFSFQEFTSSRPPSTMPGFRIASSSITMREYFEEIFIHGKVTT